MQTKFQEGLNGLVCATLPPAEAWVLPPPVTQPAEAPQIYIWGGSLDETRMTMPRPLAQKRVRHRVSLWVQWVSDSDIGNVAQFPVLLDAIRAYLRALQLPVPITDAITGESSNLLDLGERLLQQYGTPFALADQRYLLHTAAMTVPVTEILNPA